MEKNEEVFLPQAPPPYVLSNYGNAPGGPPGSMMVSVPHGMPAFVNDGSSPIYPTQSALPGYELSNLCSSTVPANGPATIVIAQGNCPKCHTGYLVERYTSCGICCAICFFPLGLICCLMMKEYKCGACGYEKSAC